MTLINIIILFMTAIISAFIGNRLGVRKSIESSLSSLRHTAQMEHEMEIEHNGETKRACRVCALKGTLPPSEPKIIPSPEPRAHTTQTDSKVEKDLCDAIEKWADLNGTLTLFGYYHVPKTVRARLALTSLQQNYDHEYKKCLQCRAFLRNNKTELIGYRAL